MSRSRRMIFGRYDYAAFLGYFIYAAGSVVVPVVLVQLARDLGFSLEDGGQTAGGALHLGRTIPMVATMLLCGFWAGRWGKRRTFGFSIILMGFGMMLCAVAPVYGILMLALVIAGIGEGVIEGLGTPFVQDLHPAEPGRYINFAHAFWSVGVVATVLIAGVLLSLGVSWRIITGGVAILSIFPAALLLLPVSAEQAYPEHPHRLDRRTIIRQAVTILKMPRFWVFFAAMFAAGGGEFCLTFWSASYIQLHITDAAWAGGVGTGCFATGMVIGRLGWGYLIHQKHLRQLIVISAVCGTGITLMLPGVQNLWLFCGTLLLAGLATAPFWPSVQSYTVDRLPKTDTTMLFILLSCAGVPGCGVLTWLMGYIGDRYGLDFAFYLVPACFIVLALLIVIENIFPGPAASSTKSAPS